MTRKRCPNVLLVIMDSLRRDHLSCYGYKRHTSPHIDLIASQGTVYENAISPSSWTLPVHASLFTGMYPSKHGADDEHQFLKPVYRTLAEILNELGYDTLGFSWTPYVSRSVGLDRGFKSFYEMFRSRINHIKRVLIHRDSGAEQTITLLGSWLKRNYKSEKPFFAFINFSETHHTYWAPEPYRYMYLNGRSGIFKKIMDINKQPDKVFGENIELDDEGIEILKALYDGEISYLDFKLNKLFTILKEIKKFDDTVIILTSDHGDNFGDHGFLSHRYNLYDSLIRIPLIIRFPGVFRQGEHNKKLVQLTDILPTLLDILEVEGDTSELWNEIQGLSLLRSECRKYAISELSRPDFKYLVKKYPGFDPSPFDRRLKALRTEDYKYIWSSDGKHELYNLSSDPGETINLISRNNEKAKEMEHLMNEWLNSLKETEKKDYRPEDRDEKVRKRLKELGYL